MLRVYAREDDHLSEEIVVTETANAAALADPGLVWIDLLSPTPEETHAVERLLGIEIPTREEMQEIEFSARLYSEDDGEFLTMTALTQLDTDDVSATPITFILKGGRLATVRFVEPKPFAAFARCAQRGGKVSCHSGELVMLGLLELMIDRTADALERVGGEIDGISRAVFRGKSAKASVKSRNLQNVIEQIGIKGDLLSSMRDSLVSVHRLLTYHAASEATPRKEHKEARGRLKLLTRDVSSLSNHASTLSSKINFLLDATLGLINLEQNQIIKIFSVAAVVFLPPTLVASIYGMNFDLMPELKWVAGYPFALGLMVISAILPYLYFKRRGWL